MTDAKWSLVQRFKFYQQHAFGRHRPLHAPLQWVSRRRVDADQYAWPLEQLIVNAVWPERALS